jgi:hypothetical protein
MRAILINNIRRRLIFMLDVLKLQTLAHDRKYSSWGASESQEKLEESDNDYWPQPTLVMIFALAQPDRYHL